MSTATARQGSLSWFVNPDLMKRAFLDSFLRLTPRYQWRNPVMFVVYIGSILTTILWVQAILGKGEAPAGFILAVTLWLWVTLLFANFAEAIAEGRSKAQAASLKSARKDTTAKKLAKPQRDSAQTLVPSNVLRKGDVVLVVQGDFIPGDGEVIEGAASIDESAITGESAAVIRAAGSDFNTVTGGTRVLSDWIIVRITVNPGEAFLDRMIGMVEGAKRQKTPNEIALTILLVAMTLVFLLATVTLLPYSLYSVEVAKAGTPVTITVLVALLVCLIPTTIGGLMSAIGVAGMGRMMRSNVIATSGRAVEAAGDCDVLLLDKTGTITFGNRQASALFPSAGVSAHQLAEATLFASLGDETPEGKSIVAYAKRAYSVAAPALEPGKFTIVPFSAQTRMSGVTYGGRELRKGALDAVRSWVAAQGGTIDVELTARVETLNSSIDTLHFDEAWLPHATFHDFYKNMHAIGRDRPGIVAAVTARLLERGLNLEDSQMTILRGHFAMTLIVGGEDDIDTEALRADLDRVRGEEGLEATALAEVEEDAPVRAPVPSHLVSVYGADHPGIVHAVASALADARIDITDLNSHLVDADGGGGAIYAMLLEVALPSGVSGEALEALLEAVRREHGVEITVREAEQDEL